MRRLDTGSVHEAAHDSWRTWLLTGARRDPIDRRRIRGSHVGLKKMLLEGTTPRIDKPYTWKEFSDAMVRQSVDEAMHAMPGSDSQLVKLAYFGGLSNSEIAGNMRMGEATVERRLRRALDVISAYIERGRGAGRRVMAAIGVWLSGRWLADAIHNVAPVGAVAAATVIVLADPAPAVSADPHAPATKSTVVPPVPSPTAPVTLPTAAPATDAVTTVVDTVQLPVTLPAVPPLPVKVKTPQL